MFTVRWFGEGVRGGAGEGRTQRQNVCLECVKPPRLQS